ncbi:ORF6N domain-containing protein [Bacteriovorax stolpii]|nr:ORF6N domain-containing protein [Bacteriovorax stolpii]
MSVKFTVEKIETMIYMIRGHRVMLDSDLAKLYGVETKRLKEQVRRNIDRFPSDFLIEPNSSELATLRSQIATLDRKSAENYVFKHTPYLFTENGVAMLSSVLQSKEAIQVNITIMRTFTKLRSFLAMESSLKEEVDHLKTSTNQLFKVVFERLDNLEEDITPKLPANRKKISLREK